MKNLLYGRLFQKRVLASIYCMLIFSLSTSVIAQENFNIELIANVEIGERGNDIWGFVDDNGLEYAVIGSREATRIFSLEDISQPIERAVIMGAASTWRDIKSYDNYLYVTCDSGQDGLLIIDMSGAPETIEQKFWKPILDVGNGDEPLNKCHNLHIDEEKGWCYLAGCNMGVGGVVILDIHTDPWNPELVGATNEFYSHDVVARGDTIYSSEINDGHFSVYNVVDRTNPFRYILQETTSNFSHSSWPSDDGQFLFSSDERPDATLDAYNISDPGNVELIDRYKPLETIDNGLIPHNPHYHNGFIYMSWNSDGLVIVDAIKPDNMVKVGSYDTFLGPHGGFNGVWGVYPFLPSGYILASDRDRGLYIFSAEIPRACYLEGIVKNKEDDSLINGANINIVSELLTYTSSNAAGEFKTGIATAGTYTVQATKVGFMPTEIEVDLENGNLTEVVIEMEPMLSMQLTGRVIEDTDGNPIEAAQVLAISDSQEIMASSDAQGNFNITLNDETYRIYVGAWGFNEKEIASFNPFDESQDLIFRLEKGYKDDFVIDQGWIVSGDAETGLWMRDKPIMTLFQGMFANPNMDSDNDVFGDKAYVTGNGGGSADDDDVDSGTSILTSKPMDLSYLTNPTMIFERWFVNGGIDGSTPNDSLIVVLSDGINTVEAAIYNESQATWIPEVVMIDGNSLDLTNVFVSFITSDFDDSSHIVEAGIDKFELIEGTVANDNIIDFTASLSPNPFNDRLILYTDHKDKTNYFITDANGKVLLSGKTFGTETIINTSALNDGVYFIQLKGENTRGIAKKIVKQ